MMVNVINVFGVSSFSNLIYLIIFACITTAYVDEGISSGSSMESGNVVDALWNNIDFNDPNTADPNAVAGLSNLYQSNHINGYERMAKNDSNADFLRYLIAEKFYLRGNGKLALCDNVNALEFYKKSADIIEKTLTCNKPLPEYHNSSCYIMAECMKKTGNYKKAVTYYNEAIDLESQSRYSLISYYNLLLVYKVMLDKGQMSNSQYYKKCIDIYDQIEDCFGSNEEIVKDVKYRKCKLCKKMKKWSSLIDNCIEYLNVFGEEQSANVLYMYGIALVKTRQYKEAEMIFEKSIKYSSGEDAGFKRRIENISAQIYKESGNSGNKLE